MSRDFIQAAHESAVVWAKKLLARNPNSWTILDTETTGLNRNDEISCRSV
jgi:DNA polymerase III epsilon subunit-like protein